MDFPKQDNGPLAPAGRMPLHRRPRHERHILGLIRAAARSDDDAGEGTPAPAEDGRTHWLFFFQLRQLAQENGLAIQPQSCRWVGTDELQLLAWIARAQRYRTQGESFHPDERLTRSIFLCAGILTGQGVNLPPVTMLARTRPHADARKRARTRETRPAARA